MGYSWERSARGRLCRRQPGYPQLGPNRWQRWTLLEREQHRPAVEAQTALEKVPELPRGLFDAGKRLAPHLKARRHMHGEHAGNLILEIEQRLGLRSDVIVEELGRPGAALFKQHGANVAHSLSNPPWHASAGEADSTKSSLENHKGIPPSRAVSPATPFGSPPRSQIDGKPVLIPSVRSMLPTNVGVSRSSSAIPGSG